MTPQTLVNDLVKGVCDAQDLVLLVIGNVFTFSIYLSVAYGYFD